MRVLIARSDGGVSIMQMIDIGDVAAEIAKWEAASGTKAVEWREVATADLPQDRTFRDAWTHAGGGKCAVDMPKARAIHMERIRKARDAELAKLDVPYLKAQERGDQAAMAQIAAQKQALRDIPQTFDLTQAMTPEALEAIWPKDLPL
ncbi:MAG: phage tail assembly chaperone [Pseudomonadota bacterium]